MEPPMTDAGIALVNQMAAALATTRRIEDARTRAETPQEFWEVLIAEGLLPESWTDDPRRRFLCGACGGNRSLGFPGCSVCRHSCTQPFPPTFYAVQAAAELYPRMLEAEALLPQALGEFKALGFPGDLPTYEKVVWVGRIPLRDGPYKKTLHTSGVFGPVNAPKGIAKILKNHGVRAPWKVALESTGEVLGGHKTRSGTEWLAITKWLNQPLFRIHTYLGFRVRKIEHGCAEIHFPC